MDRKQLLAVSALISWCTFLGAVGELLEDRRRERALQRRRELEAAAQAGAIAATLINAIVDQADQDLEAADCTDVLDLCPDPSRHEPAEEASC